MNSANSFVSKSEGQIGIYIHIPFCIQKCSYCDFFSIPSGKAISLEMQKQYFQTLKKEFLLTLERFQSMRKLRLSSIYFGGGTPSLIQPEFFKELIHLFKENILNFEEPEITLEANPEQINPVSLQQWSDAGINRLSIGVQSLKSKHLTKMKRFHTIANYDHLVDVMKDSPISNFNFDLLYGIPGQTEKDFYDDIETLSYAKPGHFSLYSLTEEDNTEYAKEIQKKITSPPDEDIQAKIFRTLPNFMDSLGFRMYEVSNFSIPDFESRHNLNYWTMGFYLGLGASAKSYLPEGRMENPNDGTEYKKQECQIPIPADYGKEVSINLFRITNPIMIKSFLPPLKDEQQEQFLNLLNQWKEQGLADFDGEIFQWKKESLTHLDDRILEAYTLF